jgi:(2Fe-2S) ferredoxin
MVPCSEGPSVLVCPEGVMNAKVHKEQMAEIFDQHLLGGQLTESLKVSPEFW